ncbi:MAG: hypothetical protein IPG68_02730 [Micrococcales bacterium]|nr:hypothetical protein [Micrococcales bacterium]
MPDESEELSLAMQMRPTLFVTLQTDLRQMPTPVQPYRASLAVRWSPDDGPDVDLAELSERTGVDVRNYVPEVGNVMPDGLVASVGEGRFTTVDLSAPDCWECLTGNGQDLAMVGEALLGEKFDQAELRAAFPVVHQRAVIVEHVEVVPEWRGAGYGLVAIEIVLRELGRCADVAALYPMQPGLTDLAERQEASERLTRHWGRLGFADFNGIMAKALG